MPVPSTSARLVQRLAAALDQSILPIMSLMFLSAEDTESAESVRRQERAGELYSGADPEAFFPAPPMPSRPSVSTIAALPGGAIERHQWLSRYRTYDPEYQAEYDAFSENGLVHVEAWRHDTRGAPALICVHSWAGGSFWLQRELFFADRLYRMGFDVILPILPFHGPRTPRCAQFGGQYFPSACPQRTNEAFGQAVWDLRALIARLRSSGSGPIGVMGMSLGGYLSAILASVEPGLALGVPIIPLVTLADLVWQHGKGHPSRRRAEARGITLERLRAIYAIHCPLRYDPLIPAEGRLIVAGASDRIITPDHVTRLWEHWGRPELHWFPGSHLAHLGRSRLFQAVSSFAARATGLGAGSPLASVS